MANSDHVARLRGGVRAWNLWRRDRSVHHIAPDLIEADLAGADLRDADLSGAQLTRADLRRADLREASLGGANMIQAKASGVNLAEAYLECAQLNGGDFTRADFACANLGSADLSDADLSDASLNHTELVHCNLARAILRRTTLYHAEMGKTLLCAVDLSETTGLETCSHKAPSTIGIDSVVMSRGNIPERFLHGCGVPDSIINQLKALVGGINPIQRYACLISYSTADSAFVHKLHSDLQASSVRCLLAPRGAPGGQDSYGPIDEAIRVYDRVVLILSATSMDSQWAKTEISNARKREIRESREILLPIRMVPIAELRKWAYIDADTGEDWAKQIPADSVPNFSSWMNDATYKRAAKRLIRELKASDKADR